MRAADVTVGLGMGEGMDWRPRPNRRREWKDTIAALKKFSSDGIRSFLSVLYHSPSSPSAPPEIRPFIPADIHRCSAIPTRLSRAVGHSALPPRPNDLITLWATYRVRKCTSAGRATSIGTRTSRVRIADVVRSGRDTAVECGDAGARWPSWHV